MVIVIGMLVVVLVVRVVRDLVCEESEKEVNGSLVFVNFNNQTSHQTGQMRSFFPLL